MCVVCVYICGVLRFRSFPFIMEALHVKFQMYTMFDTSKFPVFLKI